jgi:hypothetical protein
MTEEGIKLTMITAVGPVLADFIDDLIDSGRFKNHIKYKFQNTAAQIRSIDEYFMKDATIEEGEQQIALQRFFRQWVKHIHEQSTVHNGHSDNSQEEEGGTENT